MCLTIQLAYTKPWFRDSSYQTEEHDSDFEEMVDTWITKTDRNEKKINTIQEQIEEIGDVLEDQSEMIGKLQDLISFGQRQFDENLMMNGEEEEFVNEPMPMDFDNEEERSDEVDDSEMVEERSYEVDGGETREEEDAENQAREDKFEVDKGDEVETTESNEEENVTQGDVSDENKETLEEGK